jgi:hypothetical protein
VTCLRCYDNNIFDNEDILRCYLRRKYKKWEFRMFRQFSIWCLVFCTLCDIQLLMMWNFVDFNGWGCWKFHLIWHFWD